MPWRVESREGGSGARRGVGDSGGATWGQWRVWTGQCHGKLETPGPGCPVLLQLMTQKGGIPQAQGPTGVLWGPDRPAIRSGSSDRQRPLQRSHVPR